MKYLKIHPEHFHEHQISQISPECFAKISEKNPPKNPHVFVAYDDERDNTSEIDEFMKSEEFALLTQKLIRDISECVMIVLGGDGTMMHAIRENFGGRFAFLGMNFGHKGFLMNSRDPDGKYIERLYPLLDVILERDKVLIKHGIAWNEVDIRAGGGRLITLEFDTGEVSLRVAGDGMLISTPAGSTGYNSAVGGVIVPHTSANFVIAHKAAFEPKRQPPSVIADHTTLTIHQIRKDRGSSQRDEPIEIYTDSVPFFADMHGLTPNTQIVIRKHTHQVKLLIAENYQREWDNKGLIEQGFFPSKSQTS